MTWLALLATLAVLLAASIAGTGCAHPSVLQQRQPTGRGLAEQTQLCAHAPVLQQRQPGARQLTEYNKLTNTTELPVLRAVDRSCGRLVVVFCAVKKQGEAATTHDIYLKISVLSVLEKAPSLVRPTGHMNRCWITRRPMKTKERNKRKGCTPAEVTSLAGASIETFSWPNTNAARKQPYAGGILWLSAALLKCTTTTA